MLDALAEGRPALLEIDLQGARQVRANCPEATFVFLAPPSWEELVRRLAGPRHRVGGRTRGTTSHRTGRMAAQSEFDHVVVNDEIGEAVKDLLILVRL